MPWGTNSPAAQQWRIDEWPTTFVLDEQGLIRYRGNEVTLGGENLEEAVMSLFEPGPTER